MPNVGDSLQGGRYRLLEFLGTGGMATVFLAHDQTLDIECAIKVLAAEHTARRDLRARFLQEARTIAKLAHRNIVRIFDVRSDGDDVYIVMELLDGGDLAGLCDRAGALPPAAACDVVLDILIAVAFAHHHQVLHRDIKPQNVLFTRDRELKLADFGIAKVHAGDPATGDGTRMGTIGYAAPEQMLDAAGADERADLFSVGATFYAILTNRTPNSLDNAEHQASAFAGLPEPIVRVLRRALRYDRAARFSSAEEMADAVRAAREQLGTAGTLTPDEPPVTAPKASADGAAEEAAARAMIAAAAETGRQRAEEVAARKRAAEQQRADEVAMAERTAAAQAAAREAEEARQTAEQGPRRSLADPARYGRPTPGATSGHERPEIAEPRSSPGTQPSWGRPVGLVGVGLLTAFFLVYWLMSGQ